MSLLEIKNLHISIGDKAIVKGFNLTIKPGEVHAIMGPNGTGKSTLAKAIAGHPSYTITGGDVILDGKSILAMQPDERARSGLFLAFQYPSEIPGVSIANFLRAAVQARMAEGEELDASGYYKKLYSKMDLLKIDRKFTSRAVNDGFSGGEKSAAKFCKWPCSSRTLRSWMKRTQVSISMPCASWRTASILSAAARSASC